MSFEMALPHTQPIQAILPDGTEVKAERQDIWDLYRLVEPYIGKASARWCAQGRAVLEPGGARHQYMPCRPGSSIFRRRTWRRN